MSLLILAGAAAIFSACGGSVPANDAANSKTAPPPPAGPSAKELLTLETAAVEAFKQKNMTYFEDYLSDGYIGIGADGPQDKASTLMDISRSECVVNSLSVSDEQATALGPDAALLTYKASGDFVCGDVQEKTNVWAATVLVRAGESWKSAYHNEVPIADTAAQTAETENDAGPAGPPETKSTTSDPLAATLFAIENKGWEAWKNKDNKTLSEITAKDLTLIDGSGRFDQAGALKKWADQKCEIKTISLSAPNAVSLGSQAALLTYFGSVDGTCDGAAAPPVWGTTVFVKDGETWKAALILENAISN